MDIKPAILVIADISGYTRFLKLHALSMIHAEQVISDLLESVINAADYPLTLNRLEGDAAFLYALTTGDEAAIARDVVRQIEGFFTAFRAKATELAVVYCPCDACGRLDQLKLKVIVHYGPVVFKRVRQFENLGGEDPILIHRLLKNTIPAHEYILMTETFYQLVGDLPGLRSESRIEQYADVGQVPIKVFYPLSPQDRLPAPETYPWRQAFDRGVRWSRRLFPRLLGLRARPNFAHLPNEKVSTLAFLIQSLTPDLSRIRNKRDTN